MKVLLHNISFNIHSTQILDHRQLIRVVCPQFGHRALSSEFFKYALNTEFLDSATVGMLRKNYYLKVVEKLFSRTKIKNKLES